MAYQVPVYPLRSTKRTWVVAVLLAAMLSLAAPPPIARAATIDVTTIDDDVDVAGGCASATPATLPGPDGMVSLREAICAANNNAGPDTINLADAPYLLSIAGAGEDANAGGDLDILDDVTIDGNGAIVRGGGLYRVFHVVTPGVTVTMNDIQIEDGYAGSGHGGGVHNNGGHVTLIDSVITHNEATWGGGIYTVGGSLTLDNTDLDDTDGFGNESFAAGGGIYSSSTVTLTNGSTISDNTAGTDGGGIYVYSGSVTLEGGQVRANGAVDGGGVYVDAAGATFAQMAGAVISNTADAGGGVYVGTGGAALEGGEVRGNSAIAGGGVYIGGSSAVFTHTAGAVISNTAFLGGGVYVEAGSAVFGQPASAVISNTADAGGGVYVEAGSVTLEGGQVRGNSAEDGGGVYVDAGSAVFVQTAGAVISNTAEWYGGGVHVYQGSAMLEGGQVRGNVAYESGGGVHVETGGAIFTHTAGAVIGNFAFIGGGVSVYSGTVMLEGGEVHDNFALAGGGVGVYSGSVTLEGGQVCDNSADWDGGGVYVDVGSATLGGGEVRDNTAGEWGGGVCVYSGTVTLEGGEVRGNSAEDGGGVYVETSSAVFTHTGGAVVSNTADAGGGVCVYAGHAALEGGQVRGNTAGWYGGGVYVERGSAVLEGGDVRDNFASDWGGGVYVKGSHAVFTQTAGGVVGNSAGHGGGVFVDSGSATLEGGEVRANVSSRGGGVYVKETSAFFAQTAGRVISNTAFFGGGVCVEHGSAMLEGGQLCGNVAHYDGGGVYVEAGSATLGGGEIGGNAAPEGSALYNVGGAVDHVAAVTLTGELYQAGGAFHGGGVPLRIDGALALAGGTFDAPTGTLLALTGPFTHTGGTYRQTREVIGAGAVGFPKAGGVVLDANGQDLGSTEVVIQAGQPCPNARADMLNHCYIITPTHASGVSATVTLYYHDGLVSEAACAGTDGFRWDGSRWETLVPDPAYGIDGRDCGSAPYSFQSRGVTDFSPFALSAPSITYLPLVMRGHVVAPDLVVERIAAGENGVQVMVRNRGNAPATDDFWVDVYVDPDPAPTAVNQTWPYLADEGLVWGVERDLAPGEALTLTVGHAYYVAAYSQVDWPLAVGTPVYAQVDSANEETDYGALLEDHEIAGTPYAEGGNILGPIYVAGSGAGSASPPAPDGQQRRTTPEPHLPPRP